MSNIVEFQKKADPDKECRPRPDRCVEDHLARAFVDVLGIHPEQVEQFASALVLAASGRGPRPDPDHYKEPVLKQQYSQPKL